MKAGCPNTNRMLWLISHTDLDPRKSDICTNRRHRGSGAKLWVATCMSGDAWYKFSLDAASD